jgi:hypothetical protein
MSNKIRFPKGANAQLCFIKKVNRQKQKYEFYRASIKEEVSVELRDWLEENFQQLEKIKRRQKKLERFDPDAESKYSYFDSKDIHERWKEFEQGAFTIAGQMSMGFKGTKKFKNGYIIYIRKDGMIFGQINKISDSYILPEPKRFFLTTAFNKIVPEEGVRLNKEPDVLFHNSNKKNRIEFVIYNKNNFEFLFDYKDYKSDRAKKFLERIKDLFEIDITSESILSTLLDDNIINTLNKPNITIDSQYNCDIKYLQEVKKNYPSLQFDIENNKIKLPDVNDKKLSKQAFRELIRAISYHYALTFDDKILEVNPIQYICPRPLQNGKRIPLPLRPPDKGDDGVYLDLPPHRV